MPNIIPSDTPYTIAPSSKAVIQMVGASNSAALSLNAVNSVTISPNGSVKVMKQSPSSVQLKSTQIRLVVSNPSPTIKKGSVSGIVKAARFATVGVFDYVGSALSATASETAAVWRIRRMRNDSVGSQKNVVSAGGSDSFSFAWSNYINESYS